MLKWSVPLLKKTETPFRNPSENSILYKEFNKYFLKSDYRILGSQPYRVLLCRIFCKKTICFSKFRSKRFIAFILQLI